MLARDSSRTLAGMERILDDATITVRLGSAQHVMSNDLVKHVLGQLGHELVDRLNRVEVVLVDHNGIERVHGIKDSEVGLNHNLMGRPSYAEEAKRQKLQVAERRRAQSSIERALGA